MDQNNDPHPNDRSDAREYLIMIEKSKPANAIRGKKPFVKPQLHSLEVEQTKTGPFPDPFEFPMILQQS